MLTFQQIKEYHDLPITKVNVWGGEVCLRPLTSDEKDRYELEMLKVAETNSGRVRALLVSLCLCDEAGTRIIPDNGVDELGQKSAMALDTLYQECRKINKLDFEESKKN